MERHSAPVLPLAKLKEVWAKMKSKLGDSFDDELFDNLDRSMLNDVLWKMETKHEFGIMG